MQLSKLALELAAGDALEIGEYPVAPFGMEPRPRPGVAMIINIRAIIGIGHR